MTTPQILDRIKQDLDDPGSTWTDQDLYDSLQDGYEEIAFYTHCIEKIVPLTFTTDTYVNIRSQVPDYFSVFAIYDRNQKMYLEPKSRKEIESFDYEWELSTGSPRFFTPCGLDFLAFYPHYSAVPSLGYYLFYVAQAGDITSANELEIPANTRRVAVDYVVNDLLDQTLEIKKSQHYYNLYLEGLERTKKEVQRKSRVDRVQGLLMRYAGNNRHLP